MRSGGASRSSLFRWSKATKQTWSENPSPLDNENICFYLPEKITNNILITKTHSKHTLFLSRNFWVALYRYFSRVQTNVLFCKNQFQFQNKKIIHQTHTKHFSCKIVILNFTNVLKQDINIILHFQYREHFHDWFQERKMVLHIFHFEEKIIEWYSMKNDKKVIFLQN